MKFKQAFVIISLLLGLRSINGLGLCPTGQYYTLLSCYDCPYECYDCEDSWNPFNPNSYVCTSCISGQYLGSYTCLKNTIKSCTTGQQLYYGDCLSCPSGCSACSSAYSCSSCSSGYYLCSGSCCKNQITTVISCSTGYYQSSGACKSCPSSCSACSSAQSCSSCKSSYKLCGSSCLLSCSSLCSSWQYYSSEYDDCVDCPSECKNCKEASNTNGYICTSCVLGQQTCGSDCCAISCKTGEYYSDQTCKSCPSGCYACDSSNICTSCTSGYFLCNSLCKMDCSSSCQSGQYYSKSSSSCKDCPSLCTACKTADNALGYSCTSCKSGSKPCGTECCESKCKEGEYLAGSDCLNCPSNCQMCEPATNSQGQLCTICKSGLFLCNGDCKDDCSNSCGSSQYYSKSASSCRNCPSKCSACKWSDNSLGQICTECKTGSKICGSECCEIICDAGKYLSGSNCLDCPSSCQCCNAATNSYGQECTSCKAGQKLCGPECLKNCGENSSTSKCDASSVLLCSPDILNIYEKCSEKSIDCVISGSKHLVDCVGCGCSVLQKQNINLEGCNRGNEIQCAYYLVCFMLVLILILAFE